MKAQKKRTPGRPPLATPEKKRRNFTFRGTDELHERLSEAAAKSGRSISEEIERRLDQSFQQDALQASLDAQAASLTAKIREEFQKGLSEQRSATASVIKQMITGKFEDSERAEAENSQPNENSTLGGLFNYKPEDPEK